MKNQKYRIVPMSGSISNSYYKVQVKFYFIWLTVSDWFSTVERAEKWIRDKRFPTYK